MKNIVIIGGSYAGIHSAHRIFKEAKNSGGFKITLIAPNTHHYWNLASPRAVVPGQLTDEELFRPIAPGFSRYPKGQFEFILATAEGVDFAARKVSIRGSSGEQTIDYDFLILATGSRMSSSLPFKLLGSTEETKNALHELQAGISTAKTIVVAGGGVSGVEIAGELGEAYGQHKEIILVCSQLLGEIPLTKEDYRRLNYFGECSTFCIEGVYNSFEELKCSSQNTNQSNEVEQAA